MDLTRNGGLNGFCASESIANRLEGKSRSVLAQKTEWDRKYQGLKNGRQASEWAGLKQDVTRLDGIIKAETEKLAQEKSIADALGLGGWFSKIGTGLCKKHIRRRERAEKSLEDAENLLGLIQGSYNTLDRQQTEGIRIAGEVIVKSEEEITALQSQVAAVKAKVANYKTERDSIKAAEKQAKEQAGMVAVNSTKKINAAGFISKENLPLIGGGLLLLGAAVYFSKKGKTTTTVRKKTVKKVAA